MNGQQQMQYPQQSFVPNPYFDPYGTLRNYMGYNNPSQMQIQPVQPQSQPPPKADFVYRPVASIEEAKAATIDWDGTVYFFEDKATGRIYRKQYMDDMVTFTAFATIEIPEPPKPDYVTNETLEALLAKIEDLEKRIPVPEESTNSNNTSANNNNGKHGGFRK